MATWAGWETFVVVAAGLTGWEIGWETGGGAAGLTIGWETVRVGWKDQSYWFR